MLKQSLNWFDTALAVILAIIFGIAIGLYGWISWQPRDITPRVNQWIAHFNSENPFKGYNISISKAQIRNHGFKAPLIVQLDGVVLSNNNNERIADIPILAVSPSIIGSFKTGKASANMEIIGADFSIMQDRKGTLFLDTQEQVAPLNLDNLLFTDTAEESDEEFHMDSLFEYGVHHIKISKATARYRSELTGFDVTIPSLSLALDSILSSQQIKGQISAAYVNSEDNSALLQGSVIYDHSNQIIHSTLNLRQFIASQFSKFSRELNGLEAMAIPLNGHLSGSMDIAKEEITNGKFSLHNKKFSDFKLEGAVLGNVNAPTAKMTGSMKDFDRDFLLENWPEGVGKEAYRWISKSIRKARVTLAEFDINLTPESQGQRPLPDETLNAILHIKDAVINYVPGFPALKEVNGRVKFRGQSLEAEVDSLKMLKATRMLTKSKWKKAVVKIPNLLVDNIKILVDVPLTAPISDVARFMAATPYKVPKSLPIKPANFTGNIQGKMSMQVLDNISPKEDEVDFQLDASLNKLAYPNIASGTNLTNLSGDLKADNNSLNASFNGMFNNKKFDSTITIKGKSERYEYNGILPVEIAALFSKEVKSHLKGSADIKATVKRGGKKSPAITLDADTTNLRYTIPQLEETKPIGAKGNVSAKGTLSKSRLDLSSVAAKDNAIEYEGSLSVNLDSGDVTKSNIKKLTIGKNTVRGSYLKKKNQHHITLKSAMLDLSNLDDESESRAADEDEKTLFQRLANVPDIVADVTIDAVRFAPDREMKNLKLTADCLKRRCRKFTMRADAGKTTLNAEIKNEASKRTFTATIPDLGRLLRVTGVFDDIRNGSLQLNAIYQDELPGRPMVGRVTVEKFNAKNIPLLAKLLTVATFTGVLDALSGGGVYFEKLEASFQYTREKLVINEARATGPSIGITASGALDIEPDTLDMKGVVIPAKLFDTILSDIPLVGNVYEALTGGEGLVAVNYSMSGKADDPKVRVNPLSALTPGFLRKIFSPNQDKNAETKQDVKEAKEALEKADEEITEMEQENAQEGEKSEDRNKNPPKSLNKHRKD